MIERMRKIVTSPTQHGTDNRNVAAATTKDIARLIAAAPEMLEVLKEIAASTHGSSDEDERRINALARAAIAKAKGK